MLSNNEQRVYNEYLRATRSAVNKPYKLRKNFDDLDASSELFTKRIARLLNKFQHIPPADFFAAPFQVYGAEEYFDLKFFASQRALKAYAVYMQQEVDANPDSPQILQRVIDSLKSLKNFFQQHQLNASTYAQHITNNMPSLILHLKDRTLSSYVLQEIPKSYSVINAQDPDVMRFMFGDNFFSNLNVYRTRYLASTKCKALVRAGMKKITITTCTSNNPH